MEDKVRVFNIRPIVIVSISLIVGILVAYFYALYNLSSLFLLIFFSLLIILSLVLCLLSNYTRFIKVLTIVTLLFLILGFLVFNVSFKNKAKSVKSGYYNETFKVVKVSNKYENSNNVEYTLQLEGKFNGKKHKFTVNLTTQKEIIVGTKIRISGNFISNYTKSRDDVLTFIKNDNYKVNIKNFVVYSKDQVNYDLFYKIRLKISTLYKNNIRNNYGTAYGLITGDTSLLNYNNILLYRNLGIGHLFAVSGLHIGFFYVLIKKLLSIIKCKRILIFVLSSILTLLYTAFCGFTISCIRAYIITTVASLFSLIRIKNDNLSTLCFAMLITLIFNAKDLFSASFMLSYSACFGLILLNSKMEKFLSKIVFEKVAKVVSPCIVVFFSTLPITLIYFKSISTISVIFNLIVIPIFSIVFSLLIVCTFIAIVIPVLQPILILPELILTPLNKLLNIAQIKSFLVTINQMKTTIILYYLVLFMFADKLNIKKRYKYSLIVTASVIIILLIVKFNYL